MFKTNELNKKIDMLELLMNLTELEDAIIQAETEQQIKELGNND